MKWDPMPITKELLRNNRRLKVKHRKDILNFLKKDYMRHFRVKHVAHAVGLSRRAVKRHLDDLKREGEVTFDPKRGWTIDAKEIETVFGGRDNLPPEIQEKMDDIVFTEQDRKVQGLSSILEFAWGNNWFDLASKDADEFIELLMKKISFLIFYAFLKDSTCEGDKDRVWVDSVKDSVGLIIYSGLEEFQKRNNKTMPVEAKEYRVFCMNLLDRISNNDIYERTFLDFLDRFRIKDEKGLLKDQIFGQDEFDKFYRRIKKRMETDDYLAESVEALTYGATNQ